MGDGLRCLGALRAHLAESRFPALRSVTTDNDPYENGSVKHLLNTISRSVSLKGLTAYEAISALT